MRASAARNVAGYAALVGFDRFASDILPAVKDVIEPAQNVRAALAESLVDVTASLREDQALPSVVPLILSALLECKANPAEANALIAQLTR